LLAFYELFLVAYAPSYLRGKKKVRNSVLKTFKLNLLVAFVAQTSFKTVDGTT
jgi:hypothetical protein